MDHLSGKGILSAVVKGALKEVSKEFLGNDEPDGQKENGGSGVKQSQVINIYANGSNGNDKPKSQTKGTKAKQPSQKGTGLKQSGKPQKQENKSLKPQNVRLQHEFCSVGWHGTTRTRTFSKSQHVTFTIETRLESQSPYPMTLFLSFDVFDERGRRFHGMEGNKSLSLQPYERINWKYQMPESTFKLMPCGRYYYQYRLNNDLVEKAYFTINP